MTRLFIETRDEHNQYLPLLPLNLAFFDESEKSEEATAKKKQEARKKGQVAQSQEVSTAFILVGVFFAMGIFASWLFTGVTNVLGHSFVSINAANYVFSTEFMVGYGTFLLGQGLLATAPIMGVSMLLGIVANLIQVGWRPTWEPLRPKLSKMSPKNGLKKMFGIQALVNLAKALFKFGIILLILINIANREVPMALMMADMGFYYVLMFLGGVVVRAGIEVGGLFVLIALADFLYSRHKHRKELRMSKHEVKQEYKQSEGDPLIKGKIRQKMREASARRMMQELPGADVIITNPTHYAVALKYDKEKYGDAPVVVAKGVDFMAKRIRDAGAEHGIEIVENVQLARAIYAKVDVGEAIPPELYQAVAEVLAFVYRLKGRSHNVSPAAVGG